jgi:oligosaccharide repeat unit polymerase
MSFLLSLLFFSISYITYQINKRVVSPIFLVPFLWGIFLLLFNTIPHSLYPLQFQFLFAIFLWISFFVFGGLLIHFLLERLNEENNKNPSVKILNIYFWIVFFGAPIAIYSLVFQAVTSGPEFFFLTLRSINTGVEESESSFGILVYIFNFAYVALLLQVQNYDSSRKREKTRLFFLVFLNVLLSIVTVSRSSFIFIMLAIFILLYFKGQVRSRHYFIGVAIVMGVMFLVTFLRGIASSELGNESSFSDTVAIYLFGGMPAFDTIKQSNESNLGANTFRFFYAFFNFLGGNFEVKNTILEYTNVPILTNVYTVMYSFFRDFGMLGVAFFGTFYGFFFQGCYKLATKKRKIAQLVFAYLFPMILMQFFGEYLFSNLSTFLQIIIFSSVPFIFKTKLCR